MNFEFKYWCNNHSNHLRNLFAIFSQYFDTNYIDFCYVVYLQSRT